MAKHVMVETTICRLGGSFGNVARTLGEVLGEVLGIALGRTWDMGRFWNILGTHLTQLRTDNCSTCQ